MRAGTPLFDVEGDWLDTERSVRVVVGEAGGSFPASIRSTLEREGFHVVGHAASDVGLEAVLAGVRPEAVVLDARIGVRSVLAARQLAPSAKIIVVWPAGVSAAMADERVEPSRVRADLANVVRRTVGPVFHAQPAIYSPVVPQPRPVLSSNWERPRKPHRRVAALTVAATLALGAAAFAIGAPHWSERGGSADRNGGAGHRHVATATTSHRSSRGGGGNDASPSTPADCTTGAQTNGNGTPPQKGGGHDNGRHLGNGRGPCHPTGRPSGTGPGHNHGGTGQGHGQGQGGGQGSGPHGKPTPTDRPPHPGPQHSLSFLRET